MATTTTHWHAIADGLEPSGKAFIDGEPVDAKAGATFEKRSPVDGRALGNVAEGREEDVDAAVRAARAAFESGTWSRMAPRARKRTMLAFAAAVDDAKEELAVLSSLEMGKPVSDSLGEVDAVVEGLSYNAEAIDKRFGEVAPTPESALGLVLREPVGVVGAVTPWNYPLNMPAWKLGPALAAGNSIVLKPAEQSPLSAIRLGELASAAGLPDGVLNVVPGFGPTAGAALGRHPDVDTISFTGSGEVGKLFLRYSGESNMKAVWLECGGKSPNVILADAPDLRAAAEAAAEGIFINAGQMCNAGSRLVIERSVQDEFLEHLTAASEPWRPRHPFEDGARMGAIIDETQLDRVLSYIEAGSADGARLALGGEQTLQDTGGLYVEPTVFTDVSNDMRIAREEIFGPVLSVLPVDDVERAVEVANDTTYGLAAAVWTRDISRAHRVARALRAGNVYVNAYDRGDISMPFATYGQSGIGVDKSLHAIDKYTRLKSVWVDLG